MISSMGQLTVSPPRRLPGRPTGRALAGSEEQWSRKWLKTRKRLAASRRISGLQGSSTLPFNIRDHRYGELRQASAGATLRLRLSHAETTDFDFPLAGTI